MFNYRTFNYESFRAVPVQKRRRGNQGRRDGRRYKDIVCAFDIETTRLDAENSIMYVWQFQAGLEWTVSGRSWKECFRFFRNLCEGLEEKEYIVIYVHNLSFEFQFLSTYYHFQPDEVFATASRRILKCEMYDHLEFRCSYLHSNMSLGEFVSKMGADHLKLSGKEFNYDVLRFPWTPLSDQEWEYALNDVRGLVEALIIEMQHDQDTLYTIPLTSTGYVRRDVKRAMREIGPWYVKAMLPDWETYCMLREAFRGGNVHANRYYAGQLLENVGSDDRSSAYPAAQLNDRFPVSEFRDFPDPTPERVIDLMQRRQKATLMRVAFWGVKLKDPFWGCPYIPTDKSRNIINAAYDNGRILRAEYLEITITDIDFDIIASEYEWDNVEFLKVKYARYGKLPEPLKRCIISYYRAKTELKGVPGEEIYYTKSKNKLNSVYGMSATNPVKPELYYLGAGSYEEDREKTGPELLDEANRKAFFPYQWGVWTTAWARYRLEEGIRLAHEQGEFVYCDTDSVKYLGDVDFTDHNRIRIEESLESGAYATDPAGVTHYMGVYEYEGRYKYFATRGAKKYAYVDQNDKLHLTVAGVKKIQGAEELQEMGGISAFLNEEILFTKDENETVYVDKPRGYRRFYERKTGKRRRIYLTNCVTIRPSTKTLSDTQEYSDLLEDAQAFKDYFWDAYGERI